jgi:hypothetical protein
VSTGSRIGFSLTVNPSPVWMNCCNVSCRREAAFDQPQQLQIKLFRTMQNLIHQQPDTGTSFRPGATIYEHAAFEIAFRHFNQRLFGSRLPDCLITLQDCGEALGNFSQSGFSQRDDGSLINSIVLNCSGFEKMTDPEIFSHLGREMVNCLLAHSKSASPHGYLNRKWAYAMLAIGLVPANGKGGMTGRQVRHSIAEGGGFWHACNELSAMGVRVKYAKISRSNDIEVDRLRRQKRASHTRFACPNCDCHVRGNPQTKVDCRPCGLPMEPT